jgi:hypothetical protein
MLDIILGIFIKFPYVFYTFLIAIFTYLLMNMIKNLYVESNNKIKEKKQELQFKENPFLKYKSYLNNLQRYSNRLDISPGYSTARYSSRVIDYNKERDEYASKSSNLIKIIQEANDLGKSEKDILINLINKENTSYIQWLTDEENEKNKVINAFINAQSKTEELKKQKFLRKRKLIEKLVAPYSHIQVEFGSANYPYLSKSNKICVKSNIYEYKKFDKYLYVTADGESYEIAVVNLYRKLSELRKKGNLRKIDRNNDSESV